MGGTPSIPSATPPEPAAPKNVSEVAKGSGQLQDSAQSRDQSRAKSYRRGVNIVKAETEDSLLGT